MPVGCIVLRGGGRFTFGRQASFTLTGLNNLLIFAALGDSFVEQVLGIPMGGHLSKIMISILLSPMETDMYRDIAWLRANSRL